MPFAPVNNTNIYYEVHGEGPTIVFAHGPGGNHLSWWQQITHFSKHYRCVLYDHRTFGRTLDEEPPKGRAAFAEDLKCLLDYLEIENTAIVAHSMGGRSGSGFALRNPDLETLESQNFRLRRRSGSEIEGGVLIHRGGY